MAQRIDFKSFSIAAVIPAYRVEREIEAVLRGLPVYLKYIIVVDDASPDHTGDLVAAFSKRDRRLILLRHERNRGVGGAMVSGYRKALELGAQVVVKIDGDGQMDIDNLPELLTPLILGQRQPLPRLCRPAPDAVDTQGWKYGFGFSRQSGNRLLESFRPHQWVSRHPCRDAGAAASRPDRPYLLF
jgi:glycosyltransferase involved in cell wall biosynthesis